MINEENFLLTAITKELERLIQCHVQRVWVKPYVWFVSVGKLSTRDVRSENVDSCSTEEESACSSKMLIV